MTSEQYDKIGHAYEDVKQLPAAWFPERFSFFKLLADVTGKSVLDLGCGTGFYAREIKLRGATTVTGVDVSAEMIDAAQAIEKWEPLGINYRRADAAIFLEADRKFDVVTAAFLLNSADTLATLTTLCKTIYDNLKPGGELVALTQEPNFNFFGPSLRKYGFTFSFAKRTDVGTRSMVSAFVDPPVRFETNFLERPVYEAGVESVGFDRMEWVPIEVPDEGRERFGDNYWQDYLDNPPIALLRCRRPFI